LSWEGLVERVWRGSEKMGQKKGRKNRSEWAWISLFTHGIADLVCAGALIEPQQLQPAGDTEGSLRGAG